MNRGFYLGVFLLCFGALLISYFLIVGRSEYAFMKFQDENYDASLRDYVRLYNDGDKGPSIVLPLTNLLILQGDTDKAIAVLEEFVYLNPNSIPTREKLGQLYLATQQMKKYKENLEQLSILSDDPLILIDLANLYNSNRDYDKHKLTLKRLIEYHPRAAREDEFLQLAYDYAKEGNFAAAVTTIDKMITTKKLNKLSTGAIEYGITIYLDSGKENEAFHLAKNYLKLKVQPGRLSRLVEMFDSHGKPQFAMALMKSNMKIVKDDPDLSTQLLILQLQEGDQDEIYTSLVNKLENERIFNNVAQILVQLAVEREDYKTLNLALQKSQFSSFEEAIILNVIKFISDRGDREYAVKLKNKLGPDYLEYNFFVTNSLEMAIGTIDFAGFMNEIVANTNLRLNHTEMLMIARYAAESGSYNLAYEYLSKLKMQQLLNELDAAEFVEIVYKVGKVDDVVKQVEALESKIAVMDKSTVLSFVRYKLFLAAVSQDPTSVNKDMAEGIPISDDQQQNVLEDAFFIAEKLDLYQNELEIARTLYKDSVGNAKYRQYYASALIANNAYLSAIELLQGQDKLDAKTRNIYIEALARYIAQKDSGKAAFNMPWYRAELMRNIKLALNSKGLSTKDKRNLAYILSDNGYLNEAAKVFLELVNQKNFDPDDFEQLVYIWGVNENYKIDYVWLKNRYPLLPEKQKLVLIQLLSDKKHYNDIVSLIDNKGDIENLNRDIFDIYLYAMLKGGDFERAKVLIVEEINNNQNNFARLRKIGDLASNANELDLAQLAYSKALTLKAGDIKLLKDLALVAYFRSDYIVSEPLLQRYIKLSGGDYLTNFYYGQILWHKLEYSNASKYYATAERLLKSNTQTGIEAKIIEGYLLYKKNELEKSVALFEDLLKKYPGNKQIIAAYAEVLMEIGEYEAADKLLN